MDIEYSEETIRELEREFQATGLYRPMHVERYEVGTELLYDVKGVATSAEAKIRLRVEKFAGGGFAGQVYRVKILDIVSFSDPIEDLEVGDVYAMKIMVPPSHFSRFFRNALYWVGFQGPFQLQVNPAAVRAGALWQKFFRRGAKIKFGDETVVANVHATFEDSQIGSCGELGEWVDGRTWLLEADERMDLLRYWKRGKEVDDANLGSPEYRSKHRFMHNFVELLHDMGGHESARQYEWSTLKSQPNCLKRIDSEASPSGGLVAVDFRAGLVLLPFLPMSPGDIKLVAKGLLRGSLVQFDRGDIHTLVKFVESHSNEFADMQEMLGELKAVERLYRDSVPDITHNHIRLIHDATLWSTILNSAVIGWKVQNLIEESYQEKLKRNKVLTLSYAFLGMIPFIGRFFRKILGQPSWRKHYWTVLTSGAYLRRAIRAKATERVINWHRSGRVSDGNALALPKRPWKCWYHVPLSLLPAGFHRFLTDAKYAKERLDYFLLRPVRLYFNAGLREQWLHEMVETGKEKKLLTIKDAEVILSHVKEPYIQKYLKSLAVHLCTLPVTQIVALIVAIIYVLMHPEMPRSQAWAIGIGIVALFQVVPISPGSLVRGLYVLYLVVSERNFKDYNIAVFLGFFKYIGYLAFPIQMGYRYPTLARFMAAHWATEAVHIIPVFGERGALLEHEVFCIFYNWPLTIRRRMEKRGQKRAEMEPRYWHIILCAIAGLGIFILADFVYLENSGALPNLGEIWALVLLVPLFCGTLVTLGAGGAAITQRIVGASLWGILVGMLYTVATVMIGYDGTIRLVEIGSIFLWRVFLFSIVAAIGVIFTELLLPEPSSK
jgi:hypothetical protein